eukprot:14097117-Heterocapsa_arctica.AAC.1
MLGAGFDCVKSHTPVRHAPSAPNDVGLEMADGLIDLTLIGPTLLTQGNVHRLQLIIVQGLS